MNKQTTIKWIALLTAAFLLGFLMRGLGGGNAGSEADGHDGHAHEESATQWTCSMHPQIILPKAGDCPICGMDLIPLKKGAGGDLGDAARRLELSDYARRLARVQTFTVRRQDAGVEKRLLGRVAWNEGEVETITAWIAGRIEKMHVDVTGTTVRKGEPLVSIYSPQLLSAQEELLQALLSWRQTGSPDAPSAESPGAPEGTATERLAQRLGDGNEAAERSTRNWGLSSRERLEASREKLRLLGLNPAQIGQLEQRGKAMETLTVHAPASGVVISKQANTGEYVQTGTPLYRIGNLNSLWLELEAYESDLPFLEKGQKVSYTTDAAPGTVFEGEISFIEPVFRGGSRIVKVRVPVKREYDRLKPDMYVRATVEGSLIGGSGENGSMEGRAFGGEKESPLVIPATAPLFTGKRAVVYVELSGSEGHRLYEGREIELGPKVGDYYTVVSGLESGDNVVTRGNFNIDAAMQIQAKPSMMNPGGGPSISGHDHGAGAEAGSGDAAQAAHGASLPPSWKVDEIPESFQEQLTPVYEAYLELQQALGEDAWAAAQKAAQATEAALGKVEADKLDAAPREFWLKQKSMMASSLASLAAAKDIGSGRQAFYHVSMGLIAALEQLGYQGSKPARVFHCPMANKDQGANWLQTGDETHNPYYGESMLRCGAETAVIGREE